MNNTVKIIATVFLAVIAAALTLLVLEKAGIVTFGKHAHADVRNNTASFHQGEEHAEHKHSASCSHGHKHDHAAHAEKAEHKHGPSCSDEHKHDHVAHAEKAEHKHSASCSDGHKHDHDRKH